MSPRNSSRCSTRSRRTSTSAARSARRCASTSTASRSSTSGAASPTRRPARRGRKTRSCSCTPSTKGVTAVCANLLIAARPPRSRRDGRDASGPSSRRTARARSPSRQVMSHQAGLPLRRGRLHARRSARVGADGRRARGAEADLGAGHEARLPHAHVRLARRRDHPPRRPAAPHASARSGARRSPTRSASTSGSGCPRQLEPRVARLVPPEADLRDAARAVRRRPAARPRVLEPRRTLQLRRHVEHARAARGRAAVVERHRRRARAGAAVRVVHRRGRRRAHVARPTTVARGHRSSRRAARTRC